MVSWRGVPHGLDCSRCCRSFLAQVPIVFVCFIAAASQSLAPPDDQKSTAGNERKLDVLGLLAFALSMSSLLALVERGSNEDNVTHDPITIALAVSFVVFALALVLVETCWATNPVIPPALLRRTWVGAFCAVQVLLFVAQFGVITRLLRTIWSMVDRQFVEFDEYCVVLHSHRRCINLGSCASYSPGTCWERCWGTCRWDTHQKVCNLRFR